MPPNKKNVRNDQTRRRLASQGAPRVPPDVGDTCRTAVRGQHGRGEDPGLGGAQDELDEATCH